MSASTDNLGSCFDGHAASEKPAIIDLRDESNPVEVSYRALDAACDAIARGLLRAGLKRGDRVGILSLNRFEMVAAFFGIMRAGLVAVPISFKLPRAIVEYIVADAELCAVFHDRDRADMCHSSLVRIDFDDSATYDAFLDKGPFEAIEPVGREVGLILYTSGSTGKPKGVLLSHESQNWAAKQILSLNGDISHHTYIVAAPLFHMNGLFSIIQALRGGSSIILLPAFDAMAYARAIPRFRVTWLTSVPTMLALVARESQRLGGLDFSSAERVSMGSAPLTQALIDKVQALFPKAVISNGYGTTEAGPCPFSSHPNGVPRPAISCGYPLPGTDAELREGATTDEGVLFMRSPMLMEGYNKLPGKTSDVIREGWYRSGDIMHRDENGFFYFIGRADDMFVVGGENVWPGEVERLIEQAPGVHQAIVVPVPDDIKGAFPFAYVVRQAGAQVNEADIKAFTIANGPAYAHPRFIEFIDAIPLAATNKPDRNRLTEAAKSLLQGHRTSS